MSEMKSNVYFVLKSQPLLSFGMNMTIRAFRLALLLAPNFVDGGKMSLATNRGHYPFQKSQLDSQRFGMEVLTGLWIVTILRDFNC